MGEWKRVAEILWYSDFASLCADANQYGDCGGFEQQRVRLAIVMYFMHEYHDCLIRSDSRFDPEGRCGEFPDFEIYSDRKDCTFIHVATNKECLTAVVIAAAFGIVVTLLTAWVFQKEISK